MTLRVTNYFGRRYKYVGHQLYGEPFFVRSRTPLETPAPVVLAQANSSRGRKLFSALSRYANYLHSLII